MSILLARHGETDWNIAKRVQGTTDIPLNENGIKQAELLCGNLERDNIDLCRIYSSCQKRALTTAEIVGSRYNVPVKVIPGLEEMNLGIFEGHTWDEIQTLYPNELKKWQSDKRYNKAPNGESYQDLLERLFSAFNRIMEEVEDDIISGRDVLIITHGAVIMSLLTLKNDLDFKTSYAVINIENAQAIKLEPNDLQETQQKLYLKSENSVLGDFNMFEHTWIEFCNKMRADALNDDDFTDEMRIFLRSFLCGVDAAQRRNKFLVSPYDIYENDTRCSVIVHCPDDDYRFDFSLMKNKWILSFIECITLPVSDLSVVPYTAFQRLPQKEAEIRREKEVSKLIYFYNQFKKLVGRQKAMEMLFDGAGEFLGAKSWVPFFSETLSYIAYAAWMENCIYGEQTEIVNFSEQCCRLLFHKHIWRKLYTMTGHIQKMIDYEEYMDIFESIWKNRAFESGWDLQVNYMGEDTEMVFIKRQ